MRAFAEVANEPTIGEEVGSAIAPALTAMSDAVERIGEQNAAMQQMVAQAITAALHETRPVAVNDRPVITGWRFKTTRDKNGNMDVLATAIFAGGQVDK